MNNSFETSRSSSLPYIIHSPAHSTSTTKSLDSQPPSPTSTISNGNGRRYSQNIPKTHLSLLNPEKIIETMKEPIIEKKIKLPPLVPNKNMTLNRRLSNLLGGIESFNHSSDNW